MAFTAVIGLAAGTTAVTVVTVAAAVVEIGVALTIVGAVTGNKTLMKVGGIMTLVGGGVGLIAGAGGAAAGAAAGEIGTEGAIAADAAGGSFASSVGDGLATDAMGATVSENAAAATLADSSSLGGAGLSAQTMNDMAPSIGSNPVQGATPDITAGAPQAADSTIVADNTTVSAPTNTDLTPATQTDTGLSSRTDILNKFNAPTSTNDFFGGISNFAKNNKDLIGSAMKGMADQANADRKYELDSQYVNLKSFGNQVGSYAPRGILSGAR